MNKLFRSERGNALPIFGFVLPVVLGVGCFTIDLSSAYLIKGRLQNAADAAALSAALDLDKDPAVVKASAAKVAIANASSADGEITKAGDVVLGSYDEASKTFVPAGTPINAVRVTAYRTNSRGNELPTVLAGLIGTDYFNLSAEAIALGKGPNRCVFALDPTGGDAFKTNGSGAVRVPNCGIQVNSTSPTAMSAGGASSVVAKENCIAGSYSGAISATPKTNCALSPDPLASIPEPTPPATCYMSNVTISATQALVPGKTYCGTIKITNAATLLMENGIYYFRNANIQITQSSNMNVNNAMLFLDAQSSLTFTSTGRLNFTPPTSGVYRGISIFGSRATQSHSQFLKLGGGAAMVLAGSLYTPKHEVTMRGNSDLSTAQSGYVIANRFNFTGNSDVVITMSSANSPRGLSPGGKLVR